MALVETEPRERAPFSIAALAKATGYHPSSIYTRIKKGTLESERGDKGKVVVPATAAAALIKESRARQHAEPQKGSADVRDNGHQFENHVSYAFGHVQAWLEIYARTLAAGGLEISEAAFTDRVAKLLSASTRRKVLGP